jgi:hypothetical protein
MFTADRALTLKNVLLATGVVLTLAMGVRHGFGFWMQPISRPTAGRARPTRWRRPCRI